MGPAKAHSLHNFLAAIGPTDGADGKQRKIDMIYWIHAWLLFD